MATALHQGPKKRVTLPGRALDSWKTTGKPKERAAITAGPAM